MQHLKHNTIQYNLATPNDFDPTKKYPLIIYLHGAGGRGHDLQLPRYPFMMEEYIHKNNIDVMVAGPLCEFDNWYMCFTELIEFVRFASTMDNVDPDRVYLMGSSMGGYATWTMLMSVPELFAAAVPICGGGMAWNAYRIKTCLSGPSTVWWTVPWTSAKASVWPTPCGSAAGTSRSPCSPGWDTTPGSLPCTSTTPSSGS